MDNPASVPEKQQTTSWGTWEELLLACAVRRFGPQSWDSVTAELRKRCSNLNHLTPLTCKRKFHDLRRRFNDAVSDENAAAAAATIPWLDELRQLRLDELRRDVQRYDLSIVSLQSKVEKLKEVRCKEKSDPEKTGEDEIKDEAVVPEDISPLNIVGKEFSGKVLVRDDDRLSFDQSNTTDPKSEIPETGIDAEKKGSEPVEPVPGKIGPVEKPSQPVVEDSCNGSSDSVVAKEVAVAAESEKGRESVAESKGRESVAESKGGQSSSDVQSTASLSRKTGQETKKASEPAEPDQEDQSPTMKQVGAESQPLVDILQILRSHKAASVFERRLHSQDTPIYTNMIRQHIDFELVQTRLEGGWYSSCKSKFFRDMVLICKNATVFFGEGSLEYKAACELQLLVSKEMARNPLPEKESQRLPPKEETPSPPGLSLKPETESSDSLLAKSNLSIPFTACRKRSSIKARASTSSSALGIKKEQKITLLQDVEPVISWKQNNEVEEKLPVTKKREERAGTNSRNNSNKNSKEKNPDVITNANVDSSTRAMINNEKSELIAETEKKSNGNTSGKRQSAEKFLSRLKRSPASNNKSEASKLFENDRKVVGAEQRKIGNGKGSAQKGADQRKNGNGRGTAQKQVAEQKKAGNANGLQKEQVSCRGAGGRQAAKDQVSPTKRSVGRPSKRAAETTRAAPAKRRRN